MTFICIPGGSFVRTGPGYCKDYEYPNDNNKYDDNSTTALECMLRCKAKYPGTTAFYLHGTKCGCSRTTTGACETTDAYDAYEMAGKSCHE